ncbi:MAG: molecular chaperone [Halobacteriales archaeon]
MADRSIIRPATDRPTSGEPIAGRTRGVAEVATAPHRGRLFTLLALGLDRPGAALRSALAADAFGTGLVTAAEAVGPDVARTARPVKTALEGDALDRRWATLFGTEGETVSPYELRYLPGPLMTNVRRLADLNGFYEAFCLEPADGRADRRDHVCFQLEFLGQLAYREAALAAAGDDTGVAVVADAYGSLLEDHLGRWYWRFADEVSRRDDGPYAALVDLLAALVEVEIDRLDLEPDWVPDDPAVAEWTEGVFGDDGHACGPCGVVPGAGDPANQPEGDT